MGNPKGFMTVKRDTIKYQPREQASRCMDCGTPFCHFGCPIGNYIPEWNDLVYNQQWERAYELLSAINPMPEVTGRICPALCEYACVLGINDDPVTICENELAVIEYAFKHGLVRPNPPKKRTNKKIAVVGSGPAGLACAVELNRAGHNVVVFERDEKVGGILRFGIPDFKLDKSILDRRVDIWKQEGIKFKTKVNVGVDFPVKKLLQGFDAVCLAGGSRVPRDLKIEGRELKGVHFAMDYLTKTIDAKGKKVAVIGGGDTGADCVGTASRQGAVSIVQIELFPKPPACRPPNCPWPKYPLLLKASSCPDEKLKRHWSILTKKFVGKNGRVGKLVCVRLDENMQEIPSSEFEIEADLVILAIGFLCPEQSNLLDKLGVRVGSRGKIKTDQNFMTIVKGVFCAGDMRRGQSLVVWAISEGRDAAYCINKYLEST